MGCSTSKLDGLPAVYLCRDRCNFLEEALRCSYAIADANAAYSQSLKTVGLALQGFFDRAVEFRSDGEPDAGASPGKSSPATSSDHSSCSSDSDSPPRFDSDSDDAEEQRHRGGDSDLFDYPNHETLISNHDLFMPMDYLKNHQSTQSISNSYSDFTNSPYPHRNHYSGTRTPSPPPAPSSSSWDFLNVFEAYEVPYAMSGKESKEKEPTHDHEERSVQKNQKKIARKEEKIITKISEKEAQETKKDDSEKDKATEKSDSVEQKDETVKRCVSEAMRELQQLFEKASDAGNVVSKMFDSAKPRYHHKHSVYKGSSNIFCAVSPSIFSISSPLKLTVSLNTDPIEEDFTESFCNLSSTLKKLCMWERKLYQEVKAEEKLRTSYKKNHRRLKKLEEKGADAQQIESTRTLIRSLSTSMIVAVHTIDKISIRVNKSRDEELWPQVKELIHRLFEMWKDMLEHHTLQSQIIASNRILDDVLSNGKLNVDHLKSVVNLKIELQSWSLSLSNFLEAQKSYAKALNGWLMRFFRPEPHETSDDPVVPIEAPPMFEILNKWSDAMARLSENEFTESIYGFSMRLNSLLAKQRAEMQHNKIMGDKEIERKILMSEKDEQKMMQKFLQVQEKKMKLSGECIENSSLERIFASMERFVDNLKLAYEELI